MVDTEGDGGQATIKTPAARGGNDGTVTFNATTGTWFYTLDNGRRATHALRHSDIVHAVLTVTSLDGTATHNIDVTVTGTNDNATIAVDASITNDRAVTEAGGASNGTDRKSVV